MTPDFMMRWLWVVWLISWFAAAAWSDRSVKRPRATRKLIYQLLTVAGIILLFQPYRFSVDSVVWQLGRAVQYGLVVVALLGFLFAWWARIYLGRLWSSAVGRKANHYLVDTGPYALVRHPIYTGVILATLVTAVMRGTVLAVTGAAIMMLGWHTKARLEEQYLRDELGADTYDAYVRRVLMLVPFA